MLPNLEIKQTTPVLVTATAKSSAIDMADYEGPVWFVLSATQAGSGITHAVKLQDDPASGGTYTDITGGGFTAIPAAATSNQVIGPFNSDSLQRYVKLQNTVSGGTGEAVVSLAVVGVKKYA